MPCQHFQSGGSVTTCHQCGKCPEKCCECKDCQCPICRCARVPQEVMDKIIADQKAKETSPEEAGKLEAEARAAEKALLENDAAAAEAVVISES